MIYHSIYLKLKVKSKWKNYNEAEILLVQHFIRTHQQITFGSLNGFCPFFIAFQVLKVLFVISYKIHSYQTCYFLFYISFYTSRCHVLQYCGTRFNIIWKKDFRREFCFFNEFNQTPHPLMAKNLLSMTYDFSRCYLTAFII